LTSNKEGANDMREHNYYVPEKPAKRRRRKTINWKPFVFSGVALLLVAAIVSCLFLFLSKEKTRTITLPISFFEGQTFEEIQNSAKKNKDIKSCTQNADGNIICTITEKGYNELLAEIKKSVDDTLLSMTEGEEQVESFVSIKYNDTLSQFDVYVDPSKYSEWDSLSVLAFYTVGAMYQTVSGVPSEKIDVVVNFINNETHEVFNSGSFKDMISES